MTKLVKKDGNVEQCPTCKSKIYCKLKPASGNYPEKLQWQNEDGTAHYSFNFATKETSCGTPAATPKTAEINTANLGLEKAQLDQIQAETEKILQFQLARIHFIEQGLKNRGIPFTGAFVGMLYNQQMESLRE